MEAKMKSNLLFLTKAFFVALAGSITGTALGSAIGKLSGVTGAAVTATGFWVIKTMPNKDLLGYFLVSNGVSMIASPLVTVNPSSTGILDNAITGAKLAAANGAHKFMLDKIPFIKNYIPTAISGLGNPEDLEGMGNAETRKAQAVLEQLIEAHKTSALSSVNDDYKINGMGNIDRDYSVGLLKQTDAPGYLGDIDGILGEIGKEDAEMGEIGMLIQRLGGKSAVVNIPASLEHQLVARYGTHKITMFKHKMKHARPSHSSVQGIGETYGDTGIEI